MSVLIGGPNGRLAFVLNSLSSKNIEIIIIIIIIIIQIHASASHLISSQSLNLGGPGAGPHSLIRQSARSLSDL